MNWMLGFEPTPSDQKISYNDRLLLIGSCFSSNIGTKLREVKFQNLHNPTGITFDPVSIANHLRAYASGCQYSVHDLFLQGELWHSWLHHSDFSGTDQNVVLQTINEETRKAAEWLKSCNWLFITLGTAYSYQLKEKELPVANCHKAPKEWFYKELLNIDKMTMTLKAAIDAVRQVNPKIQIVITVSPVKHIRDGVVENTRSKARLLEAAHQLAANVNNCSYFPAYELVTEVLRDYRFYAPDMAHPNEQAVQFIFEQFCKTFLSAETRQLMEEVKQIVSAKNHRPLHKGTKAHEEFLKTFANKTMQTQAKLPLLSLKEELDYFNTREQ